jgi:ribA/ribD-fused uncharacterized protein
MNALRHTPDDIYSQWHPRGFTVDGVQYVNAEQWMMAQKALLFGDQVSVSNPPVTSPSWLDSAETSWDASQEIFGEIMVATSSKKIKGLGRKVKNFDAAVWDQHKLEIVTVGSYHKFRSNPDLKAALLATGDKVIVEASPEDTIWGIGLPEEHPHATDPTWWRGENLLGVAIVEARRRIVAEEAVATAEVHQEFKQGTDGDGSA